MVHETGCGGELRLPRTRRGEYTNVEIWFIATAWLLLILQEIETRLCAILAVICSLNLVLQLVLFEK